MKRWILGLLLGILATVSANAADQVVPINEAEFRELFSENGFGFRPDDVDKIVASIQSFPFKQKVEFSAILYTHGINFGLAWDRDDWTMDGVLKTREQGLINVPQFFTMDFGNSGFKAEATFAWTWILIPSSLSISDLERLKKSWSVSTTTSFLKRSVVAVEAGFMKVEKPAVHTATNGLKNRLKSGGRGVEIEFIELPADQDKIIIFSTKVGLSPGTLFGETVDKISGTGIQSPLSLQFQLMFPNLIFRQNKDWNEEFKVLPKP